MLSYIVPVESILNCGMELFVFRHAEWARLYNCSAPDLQVDLVPLEQRRQFGLEAWLTGGLCLLYYVLYAPCLLSIWRNAYCNGGNACYKLLLYIGATDVAILWLPGFLTPWLSLQGAVFCSHPTLIYWTGMGISSLWAAESTADLTLAFNRCLELLSPRLADKLFAGIRLYIWLSLSFLYALYWFLFEMPVLFSALHFAWYFDPFIGYREDSQGQFQSPLHSTHNIIVAIGSPIIYTVFAIALCLKTSTTGTTTNTNQNISRLQKITFLQVFIISFLNTFGCCMYVLVERVELRQWLITLTEFIWFHIHGLPPVIYLCLNKTIRDDCRKFCFQILPQNRGNRVQATDGSRALSADVQPRRVQQSGVIH